MKEKLTGKLINAIEAGNLKKAKRLVFFGASVNGFLYSQVEPPVFTASRTGNAEILRYLKSKGANLNVSFRGTPALFAALEADAKSERQDFSTTEVFIENNADFKVKDKSGNPFLVKAFSFKINDICKFLDFITTRIVLNGAVDIDLSATGDKNANILTSIARRAVFQDLNQDKKPLEKALNLMHALLKCKNVNVNLQDSLGRTPLYYAIAANNIPMIKLLAPHTDLTLLTYDGQSLLGSTYSNEAWNVLVGYGAKLCGKYEDETWNWQMLRGNSLGTSKVFAQIEKIRNSVLNGIDKYIDKYNTFTRNHILKDDETRRRFFSSTEKTLVGMISSIKERFKFLQPSQEWIDKAPSVQQREVELYKKRYPNFYADHREELEAETQSPYFRYVNQVNAYGAKIKAQIESFEPQIFTCPELKIELLQATETSETEEKVETKDGNGK